MLRGGDCWSRIAMGTELVIWRRSAWPLPSFRGHHHRCQISRSGGYGGDHTGHEQLATTRLRADHDRQFGVISGAFAPEIERFVYG